jgi:hypothetical protein
MPPNWFYLAVILSGLALIWWDNRRQPKSLVVHTGAETLAEVNEALPAVGVGPNTQSEAIRIIFKRSPEYLPETTYPTGMIRRSIKIDIKNVGNGWLSDCLLEVVSIAPIPTIINQPYAKALQPACVLNFGMNRLFTLAEFNRVEGDEGQKVYNSGPTIFYSMPGTFGGGAFAILSPDNRYLVRLRASAAQCKPHEIDLSVWVDEGRILQADLAYPVS